MKAKQKNLLLWLMSILFVAAFAAAVLGGLPVYAAEGENDVPAEGIAATVSIDGGEPIECATWKDMQQTLYRYRYVSGATCDDHKTIHSVAIVLYEDLLLSDRPLEELSRVSVELMPKYNLYSLALFGYENITLDFNGHTLTGALTTRALPIEDTCSAADNANHNKGVVEKENPYLVLTPEEPILHAVTQGAAVSIFDNTGTVVLKNGSVKSAYCCGEVPYSAYQNGAVTIVNGPAMRLENMKVTNLQADNIGGSVSSSAVRVMNASTRVDVIESYLEGEGYGLSSMPGPSIYVNNSVIRATDNEGTVGLGVYGMERSDGSSHNCNPGTGNIHEIVVQIEGEKTEIYGGYVGLEIDVHGGLSNAAAVSYHTGKLIVKDGNIIGGGKKPMDADFKWVASAPGAALLCIGYTNEDYSYKAYPIDVQIDGGHFEVLGNENLSAVSLIVEGSVTVTGGEFIGGTGTASATDIWGNSWVDMVEALEQMQQPIPDTSAPAAGLDIVSATNISVTGGTFSGNYGLNINSESATIKMMDALESLQGLPNSGFALSVYENISVTGGEFNGIEAALGINLGRTINDASSIGASVGGGNFQGAISAKETSGFISGGSYGVLPESILLADGFSAVKAGEVFVVVDETAMETADTYTAELAAYAASLREQYAALYSEVSLAKINAIEEEGRGAILLAVGEGKDAAALSALVEEYGKRMDSVLVSQIAEDVRSVSERLDLLGVSVAGDHAELKEHITALETQLGVLEQALNQLADAESSRYDELKGQISDIASRLADLAQVNELIASLETKIEGLDGLLGTMDGKIGSVTELVNGLTQKVEALNALAETLETQVGELGGMEELILALDGKVEGVEELIASLGGKADSVETLAKAIEEKVNGLTEIVEAMDEKTDGLSNLESKLDILTSWVDGLGNKMDSLNGLNEKIDTVNEDLSGQITAVLVVAIVGDIVLLAFAVVLVVRLLRKKKEQ